jgi:hypothetical protein
MARKAKTNRKTASTRAVKPRAAIRRSKRASKQFAAKIAKQATAIGRAEDALAQTVRIAVARTLREPQAVAGELYDVAAAKTQEALVAARSAGGDVLGAVQGVTRGVLLGVSDAGGDSVASAGAVVRAAVNSVVAAGGEAAAAGQRALLGVADTAQVLGVNATVAVRGAAEAVADSVVSAGESASELVNRLIKTAGTRAKRTPTKRAAKRPKKKGAGLIRGHYQKKARVAARKKVR